jgi:membrane-associated phospholipid phosphatase
MRTLVALVVFAIVPAASGAQPADEGSAAGRLLRDVASDYKNFLSIDSAETLGIGGFAAGAIHAADGSIASGIQASDPATLTGGATYGSQLLQVPMAIAWWVVGAAAGSDRHAAAGRDLLRAQISVVSWTYAIKLATDRTRPNGDPRSFPSGHASTSFAAAAVLQRHYGWKVGLPALLAAAYSGLSRVTENQHWASDVVFGAAVGIASGRTATVRLRDTRLSVAPLAVPGGGGVLIAATR